MNMVPLSRASPTLHEPFTNSSPTQNISNNPTILVYSSLKILFMQKLWLLIMKHSSTITNAVNLLQLRFNSEVHVQLLISPFLPISIILSHFTSLVIRIWIPSLALEVLVLLIVMHSFCSIEALVSHDMIVLKIAKIQNASIQFNSIKILLRTVASIESRLHVDTSRNDNNKRNSEAAVTAK